MFRPLMLTTFAAAALAPAAVFGHHSRAPYDLTREVVIEGIVTELEWRNPHIALTVETKGADGAPVLQEIEVMAVSEARALGLREDAIAVGSHVVVRARPGRGGPTARALGLDVRAGDGTLLPLNADTGLSVAPPSAFEAQSLAGRWVPSIADFSEVFTAAGRWPLTETARAALIATVSRPNAMLGICADFPPPLLSIFPDLREIEIGDSTVMIRFEAQGQNLTRLIRLDVPQHPADVAPSLLGHSIGRWEAETLVIDTIAFAPHPVGINLGVSSGPRKHLVERLTLAPDRRHLVYEMTMEDPTGLTGPASITTRWDYRPDLAPSGVACDPDIARRLLEP